MFLKAQGLYTHPNPLTTPQGSMVVAKNIVIDQDGVATPRRGVTKLTYDFSTGTDRAKLLISYQDKLLSIRTGDVLSWYNTGSGWQDLSGTYPASSGYKVRFQQAASNLYFTTSTGIKVLDSYSSTPYKSGMPKGLDLSLALTGASGFQSNDTQVAYRVVWGRKDLNGNLVLGSPSQRAVIANSSGGTRDVSLTITIPSDISATDFVQVYRSGQSATASVEPNDELYLVYEENPTGQEITARSMTFTDSTPDSLVGETLYTSPSQEGLLQSNEQPPLAKDIAYFKGSVFYQNTTSKHRLFLTIVSVGGSSGIQLNDTITIAGQTYTAKAAETIASREFALATGGSAAQNIADTTASLIRCINQNTQNTTVYAYLLSGYDDLPGKMLIEERALGGASFSAIASARGSAYTPTLPTSGTSVSSSNEEKKNGLFFSKNGESEAIPLTNWTPLGSQYQEIVRIVPLRDSLICLSKAGIFRVTGSDPTSFVPELIDSTQILIAPDSVQVVNNQVIQLTTQGICQISDSGVQVLSRPIELDLLELQGASLSGVQNYSFGIGYESDRKYMLWTIKASADTYAKQAFVYNFFTSTWTVWEKEVTCGIVDPTDDKLVFGQADQASILKERKSYAFTDFADEEIAVTVTSVAATILTLSSTAGISAGDLFYESSSKYSKIVNVTSTTIEVEEDATFTAGTRSVFKQIPTLIEWNPLTGENPGTLKHWSDVVLMFKDLGFNEAQVGFKTEISQGVTNTTLSGTPEAGWGVAAWGSSPWGGGTNSKNLRTWVQKEKNICAQLSLRFAHDCAYTKFALSGVSLMFKPMGERVTK